MFDQYIVCEENFRARTDGVGATTREFTDAVGRLFQVVTPAAEFAA